MEGSAVAQTLVLRTALQCGQTAVTCFINKTAMEDDLLKQSSMLLAHGHSVISRGRTARPAGCQVCTTHPSCCQIVFSSFEMKHARDTENSLLFLKIQK